MHRLTISAAMLWTLLIVYTPASIGQNLITLAGTGTAGFSGDNQLASTARVNLPTSVCPDPLGNIYIADRANHRIRKIDAVTGIITSIAGTGTAGFLGDGGPANEARLNNPVSLALAQDGSIYISDLGNHRIRKIDASGVISTLAGTGTAGFSGNGVPAVQAQFNSPWGITLDIANNLYIADRDNNRVRKIDLSTGIITIVAGSGVSGSAGDGGDATAANLNKPISVCVDTAFNIYFADENNHRVRKVTHSTGFISTIAGTGTAGYNGDGIAATTARLHFPSGVGVDLAGNVYISDRTNQRLRKINTQGIISTIAGTGSIGSSGDGGVATSAQLNYPRELFSDGSGNIYFADTDNHRIRKITYCSLPSIPQLSATSTSICEGESTSLTVAGGALNAALEWKWYAQACGGDFVASGAEIMVNPAITTTYFVRGEGGCVTPYGCSQITVNVTQLPLQPSEITASSVFCANQTNLLSIAAQADALSYSWTLPEGWSGSSTTNSIAVHNVSLSGAISVYAQNGCGDGPIRTLEANVTTVNTTVLDNGGSLSAEAQNKATFQWLDCLDFSALEGETSSTYFPASQGTYSVEITESGCSDTSACFNVIITNTKVDANAFEQRVFPNPFQNELHLNLPNTAAPVTDVTLYLLDGSTCVFQKRFEDHQSSSIYLSDLALSAGVYFLKVTTVGSIWVEKLIKL